MAEIKNYLTKFGCGRALGALNFALAKLACTEIESSTSLRSVLIKGATRRG